MNTILIDIYKIKDLYAGLGQFSLNFANELLRQQPGDMSFSLLLPDKSSRHLLTSAEKASLAYTSTLKRYFPSFQQNHRLWHSLYQFPSFYPPGKTPWILTIHDLNFLSEKNEKKASIYLKKLQRDVNRATMLTTISEYTRSIMENQLDLRGKKPRVIYNGIAPHVPESGAKPAYLSGKKFFFSIGIFNRKKNFHTLLPLMHHFKDYELVIAGNKDTSYGQEIQYEIHRLNLSNIVQLPGKISEPEKHWLYNHCEGLLFPSLAEGFGMPVIEAMKAGKPVFLSRHTSLPEIGGDKAFYFNAFEPASMVQVINAGLEEFNRNPNKNKLEIQQYAKRFSWETCIKQYIDLYKECL